MTRRRREPHRCTCTHYDDIHVRRTGRCLGTDSYELACECVGFEHDPQCSELRDRGCRDPDDDWLEFT